MIIIKPEATTQEIIEAMKIDKDNPPDTWVPTDTEKDKDNTRIPDDSKYF